MKYFLVEASSEHFCGFDSSFYFAAESEEDLENSEDWDEMVNHMEDYIGGWVDEDDEEEYGDDAGNIIYSVSETTESEYLEFKDSNFA